ncbi:MAG: hypothetical protein Q8K24_05870 [Hydrogenophaga sp.]|nr:hypothetical protein [Hydrogenophaga sp.]
MSAFITDDGVEVFDRPLGEQPRSASGRGGYRPGAGQKPKGYVKPQESVDYDKAKARKEAANAAMAEIELEVKTGRYGDRAAFRQASATALSSLVQTLRSIPDNIERKLGVSPEVAQSVGELIDAALDDLADEFEMMTAAPANADA